MSSSTSWLLEYIDGLRRSRFYGKITIDLREGDIVLLRKEETIKPPQGAKKGFVNPGVKRS